MKQCWLLGLFALSIVACSSSEGSRPDPKAAPRASRASGGASSPYVDRTGSGYVVGFPGKKEGALVVKKEKMASLLGLPTPHPEAQVTVPIFKELVGRIQAWTEEHGGEWLCLTTVLVRWKCNQEVNQAFSASQEAAAYRSRFDFHTGGGQASEAAFKRNMEACGRANFLNPLVLCTVDWKRMEGMPSVCLAYGACVAGYSILVGKLVDAAAQQGG